MLNRDKNKCLLCESTESLTLQHIWPYSVGGENNSRNMATLCQKCNQSLGAEIYTELYRIAGLHYGYEPSLIKQIKNEDLALLRATQISHNLMHTRCELW
ncbi:HNH endonuclease [Chromobacterium violaceum]|uniref:HNH endonuclease n=1 Tax=Chromobacterium violaceum TaxID=536 RepID=UPI0039B3CC8F